MKKLKSNDSATEKTGGGWTLQRLISLSVILFAVVLILWSSISVYNIQYVIGKSTIVQKETSDSSKKMSLLHGQVVKIREKYLPLLRSTQSLVQAANDVNLEINKFVNHFGEDNEPLNTAYARLKSNLADVKSLWSLNADDAVLKEMDVEVSIMGDIVDELSETESPSQLSELEEDARAGSASLSKRVNRLRDRLYESINNIILDTEDKSAKVQDSIIKSDSAAKSSADNAILLRTNSIVGTIILGIGFAIFSFFLIRSINGPIKELIHSISKLSENDLTVQCDIKGKTELALLAHNLNSFIHNLRHEVSEINNNAEALASSSQQLLKTSSKSSFELDDQFKQIDQVSESISESANTVQKMHDNATIASESAQNANDKSYSGKLAVTKTMDSVNAMADNITQSNSVINDLKDESNSIDEVVEVIKNIAEQTNLLALNAAIEAARAGEHGRGFSVVADEVRTLANRTQQSTLNVQQAIQRLQEKANQAVEVMANSQDHVNTTIEQAEVATNVLQAINEQIANISEKNVQIAAATENQSTVNENIKNNMISISKVSMETADVAKNSTIECQSLSNLAHKLNDIVSGFKI